jgi:fatty-acyl-CoA synthase
MARDGSKQRPPLAVAHWVPDRSLRLPELSVGGLLRRNAERIGDQPALLWPTGDGLASMSHAVLLAKTERLAHWLLEHVAPGDRVATWTRNALDAVLVHHASALAGTILVPFNPGWADPEAAHALAVASPSILFAGLDGRGQDLAARARALASFPVIALTDAPSLAARGGRALPAVGVRDPYIIQFTSGTTGRAKGALLSHQAAVLGGWLRPSIEGADEHDVYLNPVPYHHIGGSCAVILGALSLGCPFTVLERYDPAQLASLITPTGATRMGGVPTIWFDLMNHPALPADAAVRSVTLGGASVPPALVDQIRRRLGARCAIGYGLSECTIATGTLPDDRPEVLNESVGRPLPHVEVKIVDPASGRLLAPGEVGEIRIRAPTCMIGYWGDPAATAAAFDAEGFLLTGDLASMAADGVCRIHGRARELIIRGGENIYPAEIENVLLDHPAVAMAAVLGLADARLGQKVAAVVVLTPGASVDVATLQRHVVQAVSHFKAPAAWRIVDSLPLTALGKVRKYELAALFDEEASLQPEGTRCRGQAPL